MTDSADSSTPDARRPATRRRRAPRGQGEQLRGDILAAATDLLAEHGRAADVSIRSVAARVGVTPPSIYLHFADKDELLNAVCAEVLSSFDDVLGVSSGEDPLEALIRQGESYIAFALERPEHYRLMFMSRPDTFLYEPTPEEASTISGLAQVVRTVVAAQESGSMGPGDPTGIATRLWCAVHGVASLLIAKPHFPWGDRAELVSRSARSILLGVVADSWLPDEPPAGIARHIHALVPGAAATPAPGTGRPATPPTSGPGRPATPPAPTD